MPSSVLQGEGRSEGGSGEPWGGETSSGGGVPVSRVLEIRVVLEGGVTENHRGLRTAAHREGVSNDCPLGMNRQPWVGVTGLPIKWMP